MQKENSVSKEELIWEGRPSQIVNLHIYLVCGLLCFLVVPLIYGIYRWLLIRSLKYELTTQRLRTTHGILNREYDEIELYRIKDLSLTQPLFLRMFSLGNVMMWTSDKSTPELAIEAIVDSREVHELLRAQVERRRDEKNVREVDFD